MGGSSVMIYTDTNIKKHQGIKFTLICIILQPIKHMLFADEPCICWVMLEDGGNNKTSMFEM